MLFENTKIEGVRIINSEPFADDRGFFNRIFCQKELEAVRSNIVISQINHSMTKVKGTIRGMHFQHPPYSEMKIVRCIKGSIFDVAVDLRRDSPTFLQWHGEILSADNMKAMAIPEGCAHGFQSLEDDIEMIYFHTQFYSKQGEGAIRFDDPIIDIKWSMNPTVFSERDAAFPYLTSDYQGIIL